MPCKQEHNNVSAYSVVVNNHLPILCKKSVKSLHKYYRISVYLSCLITTISTAFAFQGSVSMQDLLYDYVIWYL